MGTAWLTLTQSSILVTVLEPAISRASRYTQICHIENGLEQAFFPELPLRLAHLCHCPDIALGDLRDRFLGAHLPTELT